MIHKTTRSILSVLLAALLLVTSTPLTPAFAGEGAVSLQSESGEGEGLTGSGTEDAPYQIGSAAELLKFAQRVNDGETDASAKLMNDIDLSSVCSEENGTWTPIGTSINQYRGTFDGANYTISGLYINNSRANDQGLFGYVSGTVKDLTVSGSVSGGMHVGGVVGLNGGSVEDCYNIGKVSGSIVGGVVGWNDSGTVKNCYNIGDVSGNYVGGVVGQNSSGDSSGDSSASVTNCYNTGAVSGGEDVGGVVGNNSFNATVTNCYNTGNVSGPGSVSGSNVGGVVGYNSFSVTVTNCYNTGNVSGPDSGSDNNVGGVVGYNDSGTVENSYNTGKVSGPDSGTGNRVGGVVGWNISSVTNCYNTGSVSGPDSGSGNNVGGVVGLNSSGNVTDCYFLQTDDVNKDLQGIGNDSAEGAAAVNDLNELCKALEDSDTWTISPFYKHPVLQENPEGGDGTAAHPYEIKTAAQLKTFRDLVNDENGQTADTDAHAKLMNNIDLSSVCGPELSNGQPVSWEPIGTSFSNSYSGNFDGDGHTISGLYINNSIADYQGLFGRVNGGTVQDLTVSGSVKGDDYVGGVVGYNYSGIVTGCIFSGSGSVSGVTGSDYVGGVVGG